MYHSGEQSVHGKVHYVSHLENKFINLLANAYHTEIVIKIKQTKVFLSFVYLATKSQRPEHSLTQFLFYEPLPAPHYYLLVEISRLSCNFQYR